MTRVRSLLLTLLVAAGIALLAAACGDDGDAADGETLTTVDWVYDWVPTAGDIPMLAAIEHGWFAEEGLEIDITPGSEIEQVELVGTGQHDITVGPGVQVLIAREQGLPVKAIGLVQPVAPVGLTCRTDKGIVEGDPQSLQDKRIGIWQGNPYHVAWGAYSQLHGIEAEEVAVGFDMILLLEDRVDCFPGFMAEIPARAEEGLGEPPITFFISEDVDIIGQVLVTREDYLEANPEVVEGFVRAYARGMQWALQNRDEAVDLMLSEYDDYGEDVARTELPALQRFWLSEDQEQNGILWMDENSWQPTHDALLEFGFLQDDVDISEAIVPEVLPDPSVMP